MMCSLIRSVVVILLATGIVAPIAAQSPRTSARVRTLMARMPIEHQVAQRVMRWLLGNYAGHDSDELADARMWVDSLRVGGIIISIGSPLDVAGKLNFLQRRSRLPLLIAADLEGGAAFRFPGATPFPTNMGVAATGRESDAHLMGKVTGLEARAVGVHLTFSPVADINDNPANPIINTRSFGGDPATVARLVAATVAGTRESGVLSTVKHFPGHGNTDVDSHISLPIIRGGWARLDTIELVPFRAAVKAGVDVVMSGHLALPGFDPDSLRPATLSPLVMTSVLRDSLGFQGLVVTDALDMGALVTSYGGGEAAVRAFLAGSDMLLMPADPRAAIAAMVEAVQTGRISRERLGRSVRKVLMLKERLALFERRVVPLERVGAVVGQRSFIDSARAISARSLVLVRDSGAVVATLRDRLGPVAVVSYGEPGWATTFPQELTKLGYRTTPFRLYPTSGPASYDSARAVLSAAPAAIVSVAVRARSGSGVITMPDSLAGLIDASSRQRPTVLVSFGSPYLQSQVPGVPAFLQAWTNNPLTEAAAAAALAGAPISGRLPIDLPAGARLGDGIALPAHARYHAANQP